MHGSVTCADGSTMDGKTTPPHILAILTWRGLPAAEGICICGYENLQYNGYVNSEEWALHCVHGAHEYGREYV